MVQSEKSQKNKSQCKKRGKKLNRDLNAHVQQSLKKSGKFLHPKDGSPTFRKQVWGGPLLWDMAFKLYIVFFYMFFLAITKIGSFPEVGVKIKDIWNHHPDMI